MAGQDVYHLLKRHAIDPPEKAWKQFAPLFDLTPVAMANDAGAIESYSWIAGACIYAQVAIDGNAHKHTEKHMSQSSNLLFVHRFLSGGSDGRCGEVPFSLRPGPMIMHDYSRPFEGIQPPSLLQAVYIPHALIGFDPQTMPAMTILNPDSPQNTALSAAFDVLIPELLSGVDHLAKDRARQITALVREALPKPDAEPDLRMQIQNLVETCLIDPNFNIQQVMAELAVSRAQVFDAVSVYGGFETYLSVRRTYRALFDLTEHESKRSNLEETALSWGFPTLDAFRRAAWRHYKANLDTVFQTHPDPGRS